MDDGTAGAACALAGRDVGQDAAWSVGDDDRREVAAALALRQDLSRTAPLASASVMILGRAGQGSRVFLRAWSEVGGFGISLSRWHRADCRGQRGNDCRVELAAAVSLELVDGV